MNMLRTPPVLGALIGIAVTLGFAAVVTAIAGSDSQIWWWPAVAVFVAIGGAVMGSLFGAESEGPPPDEAEELEPGTV
jgi:hypothetical protein